MEGASERTESDEPSTAARLLIAAITLVPVSWRTRLGALCGRLFALVPTRDRHVAELQMRQKLSSPPPVSDVYAAFGMSVMECFSIAEDLDAGRVKVRWEGLEELQRSMQRDQALVLLSAHTGNWDLLCCSLLRKKLGGPALGRKARSPFLQQLLSAVRKRYGAQSLWRDEFGLTREVVKILKRGEPLGVLIDQDTALPGIHSHFFGFPAWTPTGIVEVGLRYGAAFATAFIFREAPLQYTIYIARLESSGGVELLVAEYHRRLEQLIRRYPEQWVWMHKRWRTLPDGTRRSGAEYIAALDREAAGSKERS